MLVSAERVVAFLLAAIVVALIAALPLSAKPGPRGWRSVTPGPMHWAALWLSAALSGFMGWIYLFVGSSRPDAEFQMQVLFWLIVVFGSGAVLSAWTIRAIRHRAVSWRGTTVTFLSPKAMETRALSLVATLEDSPFRGVTVTFADGAFFRLDPYSRGAAELIERISVILDARNGTDAGEPVDG